jgi:site-specific DNA recombinase
MKKRAIIYVRVSTDEQSEKGYSLKHQEERLRQYCGFQDIEVVGFYKEDHSAKSFERPAFNELLRNLKKVRGSVNFLLFLKWDRFSRNAGDAYMMINTLNKLGVEPQAIEQPLDLSVPENKIMLAFYLAAPEVENDRRSLNTIAGMRRAMKEGRYVTTAPKGYRNTRNELNRPVIVPGNDAHLVRWTFEEIAKGVHSVKDVWRMVRRKGLNVSRSHIWLMLRNPIYCGKIFIPAYKDEGAVVVSGLHEPIVSEDLFYEVQDALNGKKRKPAYQKTAKIEFQLRGLLICSRCGKRLTGSAVKGNGGTYYYYHCLTKCGERFSTTLAHEALKKQLNTFAVRKEYIDLFEEIAHDHFTKTAKEDKHAAATIETEIEKCRVRLKNAQDLRVDGELEASEYKDIKKRYEDEIEKLERSKRDISLVSDNLLHYIKAAADILRNVQSYFNKASLVVRQKLIGLIFSGKLVFQNNSYQTTSYNLVVQRICSLGKDFGGQKKNLACNFASQSYRVTPPGFKPGTY